MRAINRCVGKKTCRGRRLRGSGVTGPELSHQHVGDAEGALPGELLAELALVEIAIHLAARAAEQIGAEPRVARLLEEHAEEQRLELPSYFWQRSIAVPARLRTQIGDGRDDGCRLETVA